MSESLKENNSYDDYSGDIQKGNGASIQEGISRFVYALKSYGI